MKIRAKMEVLEVIKTTYSERVKLACVCGGTPEENSFSSATPSGNLEMTITNTAVHGALLPGHKFYIDLTPAE